MIDIPKSSLTNQGETKMQDEVTLEELLEFSQDMAENFPDDSVDLNSENMWITAQWASSAYKGQDGRFDTSTFNYIEMFTGDGVSVHIDIPEEFSKWNKAVVRNSQTRNAEFSWEDIKGSIEGLIEEKSAGG